MNLEWWHWVLLAVPIAPNLWSIRHIGTHRFAEPVQRLLWLTLCIFVPCLGGLMYILFGRRRVLHDPA